MKELCQSSINGRGGPIAPIPIQATDFGLRRHMIQQVQNTCQFHGLPGDDANRRIDKFLEITQHMKQNSVSDDALRLFLFPYSLSIMLSLVTQIDTFYNGLTLSHRDTINAAAGGTFMQKTPEECYELIENMTAHHNHWDTLAIRDETSRNISSTSTIESPKEVDREPKTITDQVLIRSTNNVPPLVVQPSPASTSFSTISSSKMPEVTKDTPKPTILYPSRVNKQKLREKYDNLTLKFVEIFWNLHFELNFTDALLHMPKFALIFKSLLNNKEKLFDLAMTLVNKNCSEVILNKFPKKLGDPGKPFLRTERALIDVYGEELTLRVNDEAITFKVDQTSKYSYNDAESINRVVVIDVACEEYVQE
nr:reverse transcriptase domain-containing protein [Tanacetum cinerariifolium]